MKKKNMKIITQNLKQGTLTLEEIPLPVCKPNGILVKTIFSAISIGTEKMKLNNADMNYLQMAKAKPEQFKQVLNTISQLGPVATYRKVMNKLDSLTPLGYSLAGEVVEVGDPHSGFVKGDLVACAGGGYANHAEVNFVPSMLCVKIDEGIDLKQASLTTIATIALQGFRQANINIGENVAVIGLGLIGQILIQLIHANGGRSFGFDINHRRCQLAKEQGAFYTAIPSTADFENEIFSMTNGYGCDSVIITTATQKNLPTELAGRIARDKATIVDIGITKLDIPWDLYYHKELDVKFSRSYGPGRYDSQYEEKGIDYPIGYVRWTEQRNMESILQLLKDKRIDFSKLITHEFDFENALSAYSLIKESNEDFLGVVLKYNSDVNFGMSTINIQDRNAISNNPGVVLGGIGAGNYSSTMLYPFLKNQKGVILKGIATATGINAKDKAQKIGFSYATTDYKSLLLDKDINTLLIATRHNQHAPMVLDGLSAGKNIFIEKPLAINIEQLRDIKNSLTKNKVILMVGYNRRYAPSLIWLKKQLNPNIPYSIYYQVNAGSVPMDNWYQSPEQGGRLIGEVGHFVDTLQFLLNASPTEVFANSSNVQGMPNQDNTLITIKFDNGSCCVIAYVADGDKNYSKEKILITGFQTNIEFDNFKTIRIYKNGKHFTKKFISLDKGQKEEMSVFVKSFTTGVPPIKFESLALTSLTTFYAVESLHTKLSYRISSSQF